MAVKITETKLDLFQAPQNYALAHAVESSFCALKGTLAWQFEMIFGDVDELRKHPLPSGNMAVLEHNTRFVYFLVTKPNLYVQSTYEDLQSSLICMREHMRLHEITKVAMPRIGCGNDGLEWKQVKRLIQQIFANEFNIEILVCTYNDFERTTPKCQIKELSGDLFEAPKDFALVHSVSADFAMCGGMNLQFKCKYGQTKDLQKQNKHIGNVAVLEQGGRFIYNLVTKEHAYEKCTYTAMYYALIAMREHMREHSVSKLAIPRLGCGIDRLDWLRVKQLLELVFINDKYEIVAFFYQPPTYEQDGFKVTCPTCHHIKILRPPRSNHSSRLSLYSDKTLQRTIFTQRRLYSMDTSSSSSPTVATTTTETTASANPAAAADAADNSKYKLNELEGDLFSAPKTHSLAHCVGSDFAMAAGIAVKFKEIYGKVDELLGQNAQTGQMAFLKDDERFIYYLVTKPCSWDRPTYASLRASLETMRDHMQANKINKLAIPRIGCGIDGLEWDKVSNELKEVFGQDEIEIVVYNFVPK